MSYTPGNLQFAILQHTARGEIYDAVGNKGSAYPACLRLHDRGYLSREPSSSYRFNITTQGRALLKELDARGWAPS